MAAVSTSRLACRRFTGDADAPAVADHESLSKAGAGQYRRSIEGQPPSSVEGYRNTSLATASAMVLSTSS